MILFADTFHCFFFCASLPFFSFFSSFYSLCALFCECASWKNKTKKKGRRGEKRKQTTLIRELCAVGIAKKPLHGKFNLFSLFFLLTESWNYKSRYIHAIPRVSASLQSWGKFFFNSLIFHQKKHLLSHFDLKKCFLSREKLLDLISNLPKVSLSICKIQNCFF